MKRKIIEINEEKCNGCGLCIEACHEGALALVDGKAKLISDSYCDGLGDCLPKCPVDAIQIIEREAAEFDEKLVAARNNGHTGGCPSAMARKLTPVAAPVVAPVDSPVRESALGSWPVQIKLVPVNAPYFDGADLLIAADCTAFAYANIHEEFMKGKITLIGCPKLDEGDYTDKLREIIKTNDIRSVTILRMEVPCCSGLLNAAKNALQQSGKMIPWGYKIISINGNIVE